MSTRSIVLIEQQMELPTGERDENGRYIWEEKPVPVARFYRHSDGYPDGGGAQLAIAIAQAERSDAAYEFVPAFLAAYTKAYTHIEFEPCDGPDQFSHGDLEWVYKLTFPGCNGGEPNAQPRVEMRAYAVNYADDLGADYANLPAPEFAGTWEEFATWLKPHILKTYYQGDQEDFDKAGWFTIQDGKLPWQYAGFDPEACDKFGAAFLAASL